MLLDTRGKKGMILYVDETETDDYFIVSGLLAESRETVNLAYKQFKNKIRGIKISPTEKQSLFHEFKSVKLEKHHQKIKIKMLEEVLEISDCVIYSTYLKKDSKLLQEEKEVVYIELLKNIVGGIEESIDVVFDTFNKKDFEKKIILSILPIANIESITSADSVLEPGLQFIDNICGAIRLKKSDRDEWGFFNIIENIVREI